MAGQISGNGYLIRFSFMTKRQLIRNNERMRRKYENKFYRAVKESLDYQIEHYLQALKKDGVTGLQARLSELSFTGKIEMPIQQMYIELSLEKANTSLKALRALPKVRTKKVNLGFNSEWTAQILEYFGRHLFDLVVLPISDTTRNYIQLILNKGIEEGWSIERMVQEIEREDYIDGRVRRILRTESNRAINFGGKLARDKWEFKTQKRWIAVHDNRTRHAHLATDGQTVDSEAFFTVGGEQMEFPGDPEASGKNTINCRCFAEDVAVRDGQGRLIPKDGNRVPVRIRGRLRRELQGILNELT
jgi:hypothetical protein